MICQICSVGLTTKTQSHKDHKEKTVSVSLILTKHYCVQKCNFCTLEGVKKIMNLQKKDIIKHFEPNEMAEIDSVRKIGNKFLITAIGCSSKQRIQKLLSEQEILNLERVSGSEFSYDGDAEQFLLGVEAERISIAYQFDPMFAVNSSVVDELPHQVEAVYKYLLPLPRIRFLLADDTGAGKTIMTGLLLKEMFFRGTIQRVLIITPGGLTRQWVEDELQDKFGLCFRLIDRAVFKSNPNEFAVSDRCVTSIDFIRQPDVLATVALLQWDIIIVDEAHKLSAYEYGAKIDKRERYKAVEKLSSQTDHLLLLTATPHRGRKDTFRRLMMLLDQDLFTRDEHVDKRILRSAQNDNTGEHESFELEDKIENANNRFFLRRLKEDMINWDSTPLYVKRESTTIGYDLTSEEFQLYTAVTGYVRRLRKAAKEKRNKNVELMLMVMQRRLASSIYAITRTLENRAKRLEEVLILIKKASANQKKPDLDNADEPIPANIEEYDELNDDEGDKLFDRKISRFVLSLDPEEIQKELEEVRKLVLLALSLKGHEEQKFAELRKVLDNTDILRDESGKLVIFTEHRDTLDNLRERLEGKGISISVIHGKMNVDERKKAQREFRKKSKILIATDAAGEGINLQFCNYLINWDIPWNPNRLEQRMGRIHRYGQKNKVRVYNIVAQNTREGIVLKKVLDKLDIMREQLGTDRVYDVIDDLLEDVSLSALIQQDEEEDDSESEKIEKIDHIDHKKAEKLILLQKKQSLISKLDLNFTANIRNLSDERRLQPLYIERFFTKALAFCGGSLKKHHQYPVYYLAGNVPGQLSALARERKIFLRDCYENPFVFDKSLVSIASQVNLPENTKLMGPGHPLFDTLIEYMKRESREAFAKGVKLINPNLINEQAVWLTRSTVKDNRSDEKSRIAHQRLDIVVCDDLGIRTTSAAYLIDSIQGDQEMLSANPNQLSKEDIAVWAYEHITEKQLERVRNSREHECEIRKSYLHGAFTDLISDRICEISELDQHSLYGENVEKDREQLEQHVDQLKKRRADRLEELEKMLRLDAELPDVLTSAKIFPLSDKIVIGTVSDEAVKYLFHRDDEVENIGMQVSIMYEKEQRAKIDDVSSENLGYDLRSERENGEIRYIEVKGRAKSGAVILTENEVNRLNQLGDKGWLYIVTDCRGESPKLHQIQNPAAVLKRVEIFKQVQYLVKEEDWKRIAG